MIYHMQVNGADHWDVHVEPEDGEFVAWSSGTCASGRGITEDAAIDALMSVAFTKQPRSAKIYQFPARRSKP